MGKKWSEIVSESPAGPLDGSEVVVAVQGAQTVGLDYATLKAWLQFKNNLAATTDPGVNDDSTAGYEPGSRWLNNAVSPKVWWICTDATAGAAVWDVLSLSEDELGSAATAAITDFLQVANNGSDIADPAAFRAALGLLGMALEEDSPAGGWYLREDGVWINSSLASTASNELHTTRAFGVYGANPNPGVCSLFATGEFWCIPRDAAPDVRFLFGNILAGGGNYGGLLYNVAQKTICMFGSTANTVGKQRDHGFVVAGDKCGVFTSAPSAKLEVNGDLLTGSYTVATLPSSPAEGARVYASDGLKSGETTGNGTGVPVYYSNGAWRVHRDDSTVTS